MNLTPQLQREIGHLNEEDYKKIFPQQYYQKYAAHHNVLEYQKQVFKQLKYNNMPKLQKVESQPQFKTIKPTKLNRFDAPEDVVVKNKMQTKRMNKFVKDLGHKLKEGPVPTTTKIRTPIAGFADLPQTVVDRLKLIEDAQYETQLQNMRQQKRKDRKYMNFVPRSRYNSISVSKIPPDRERSIVADSIQSKSIDFKTFNNMSNTMLLHSAHAPDFYLSSNCDQNRSISYAQKVQDILNHTKSQIIHLNPQEKHSSVKCIMAMNRSIKRMSDIKGQIAMKNKLNNLSINKKLKTTSTVSQPQTQPSPKKPRKNLIQMTQNIRKEVYGIEMLSRYKQAVSQRKLQQHIQELK